MRVLGLGIAGLAQTVCTEPIDQQDIGDKIRMEALHTSTSSQDEDAGSGGLGQLVEKRTTKFRTAARAGAGLGTTTALAFGSSRGPGSLNEDSRLSLEIGRPDIMLTRSAADGSAKPNEVLGDAADARRVGGGLS